jgi:hypothetical protein
MATIPPKQDSAIAEQTALRRFLSGREDQVFLVLTLLIGALVGLIVVAFILLTERVGQRLYPQPALRGTVWCSLWSFRSSWATCFTGIVPMRAAAESRKRKAALCAREGRISLRTVSGKFRVNFRICTPIIRHIPRSIAWAAQGSRRCQWSVAPTSTNCSAS